jgi:hypothetical protein
MGSWLGWELGVGCELRRGRSYPLPASRRVQYLRNDIEESLKHCCRLGNSGYT